MASMCGIICIIRIIQRIGKNTNFLTIVKKMLKSFEKSRCDGASESLKKYLAFWVGEVGSGVPLALFVKTDFADDLLASGDGHFYHLLRGGCYAGTLVGAVTDNPKDLVVGIDE